MDESDAGVPLVGDLFVCRDYETKCYSFRVKRRRGEDPDNPEPSEGDADDDAPHHGDSPQSPDEYVATIKQPVEALGAATTDFDLTGQIVWLVSVVTSHYIAQEGWRDCLHRHCVELGAGTALLGMTATRWARSVALTDNEDEVLSLLQRNLVHAPRRCSTTIHCVDWGSDADHVKLSAATGVARYPVVLGADIVFWSSAIQPLFQSVSRLLARPGECDDAHEPVFILGYFNRVDSMRRKLLEEARGVGLAWVEVPWDWLGPAPPPAYAGSLHAMTIFRFRWPRVGEQPGPAAGAVTASP